MASVFCVYVLWSVYCVRVVRMTFQLQTNRAHTKMKRNAPYSPPLIQVPLASAQNIVVVGGTIAYKVWLPVSAVVSALLVVGGGSSIANGSI